jgi:hypothetical protein
LFTNTITYLSWNLKDWEEEEEGEEEEEEEANAIPPIDVCEGGVFIFIIFLLLSPSLSSTP